MLDIVAFTVFPAAMAFAGSFDLFTMTIPNRVSLFLVAAFCALAPFAGFTPDMIGMHVLASLSMLAVGVFCWHRGWVGGGDAKIFAAAALWFGFEHLGQFAYCSALAGAALAITLLVFRRVPVPSVLLKHEWIGRLYDRASGVPYGVAFALGAIWVYPATPWAIAFGL